MTSMTLNEYHRKAGRYRLDTADEYYVKLNLVGEVGELMSYFAKCQRDMVRLDSEHIKKELGDILWHVAIMAGDWEMTLGEIAQANLDKLHDRAKRGVITGSGDNR